jgi:hypothetical protein
LAVGGGKERQEKFIVISGVLVQFHFFKQTRVLPENCANRNSNTKTVKAHSVSMLAHSPEKLLVLLYFSPFQTFSKTIKVLVFV